MLVKVWNDNVHKYEEDFRSKKVSIPPKGFVEMEEDMAQVFLGTLGAGPRKDSNGNFDPRSFKKLRIEAQAKKPSSPQVPPVDELQKLVDAMVEKRLAEKSKELPKK